LDRDEKQDYRATSTSLHSKFSPVSLYRKDPKPKSYYSRTEFSQIYEKLSINTFFLQ